MLDYTHTVTIDETHHTRLFGIMNMDQSHVEVLAHLINNKPIPLHLKPAAVGLKQSIENLITNNAQPFPTPVTGLPPVEPPTAP